MRQLEPRTRRRGGTDEAFGDARALASQNAFPALAVSENVAKLIAILATFSRTGHN